MGQAQRTPGGRHERVARLFLVGGAANVTAAALPPPELFSILAASVRLQQIAWIKVVVGTRDTDHVRGWPLELWVIWTALMPKPPSIRHFTEAEDFFDAAAAIGANDQYRARQFGWGLANLHDDIVMEFALGPMIDVFPAVRLQSVQHAFEALGICKLLDRSHVVLE